MRWLVSFTNEGIGPTSQAGGQPFSPGSHLAASPGLFLCELLFEWVCTDVGEEGPSGRQARCVQDACFPGSALVPVPSLSSLGAASKYTKVEQLTLRERLARLNTHTLSKKTTRLSQLLKQEAGLVPRVSTGGGRVASQPFQGGRTVPWVGQVA